MVAWGNHTATYSNGGGSTGAQYNPFRYRGYYYDIELGLYYLNSRYYDSNIGRFVNSDHVEFLGANQNILCYNLFIYCSNNPITYVDSSGNFNVWNFMMTLAVVATITYLCVSTAGFAATAAGISVASTKLAVATGCIVASGISMMEQIYENGDITNIIDVANDTLVGCGKAFIESYSKIASYTYIAIDTLRLIAKDTISDVGKGVNFKEALKESARNRISILGFDNYVDYFIFPILSDILHVFIPEGSE